MYPFYRMYTSYLLFLNDIKSVVKKLLAGFFNYLVWFLCCILIFRLQDEDQLLDNQKNLLELAKSFLDFIINSLPAIPLQLRTVCHCLFIVSAGVCVGACLCVGVCVGACVYVCACVCICVRDPL